MSKAITVEFGVPSDGWIEFCLVLGRTEFRADISCVPSDTVTDIAHAIAKIASGVSEATVFLNEEPHKTELQFNREGDDVWLRIRPQGEGGADVETVCDRLTLCLTFFRAMRQLESRISNDDYAAAWGSLFPHEKLSEVKRLVEGLKDR